MKKREESKLTERQGVRSVACLGPACLPLIWLFLRLFLCWMRLRSVACSSEE